MLIEILVRKAEKCTESFSLSLLEAANICEIPYSTFCRYRLRMHKNECIIRKRGRKPLPQMVDYYQLELEIRELKHGKKRTAGTGKLREKYKGIIPRRELNRLINEVRQEIIRGRRQKMTRIKWHCPHMVWSMDDFEYIEDGVKSYVHQVQDLTAKHKFEPLVSKRPFSGEEVAGNLTKLFKQYGAPLILKSDNGANFKSIAVKNVLNNFKVIFLNNPPYYPQYNGSMERAQREVKQELRTILWKFKGHAVFPFAVKQAVHNLNHKPRPVLGGECSCFQWQVHSAVRFSNTFRIDAYKTIKQLALDIAEGVQYSNQQVVLLKSWRKAVETWLHVNGHITIKRNGKVLPI